VKTAKVFPLESFAVYGIYDRELNLTASDFLGKLPNLNCQLPVFKNLAM